MVKSEGKEQRETRSRSKPQSRLKSDSSDSRSRGQQQEESYETKSSESSISTRKSSRGEQKQDTSNASQSTSSSSSSAASTQPVKEPAVPVVESPVLLSKKDIYESVVNHENRLAADTNAEEHAKDFRETSEEFQEVMKDISDLKDSGEIDQDEMEDLKTEGLLLLAKLRHLNRISKLRLKLVKDEAFSQRQEVDRNHLLLQNLLYEATHLKKQVEAVEEYKGEDDEIELIPTEKFYEDAPPDISKPEITRDNDHLLRIARLEHEFYLRQELSNKCTELEKEKDKVSGDIEMTRKKLESTRPLLQSVLDSTKPVQEYLGMNG